MSFPVTIRLLGVLDERLHHFVSGLTPPVRIPLPNDDFRWEYPERSPEVVQVAKAARAVAGLRAAFSLALDGFTTECARLLRIVSDFSAEIMYLGEGLSRGTLTADQQRFVEQHFSTLPSTPDDLAAREREYYIGRKDMAKASDRLAATAGGDADAIRKLSAFLNKGYDGYVHGTHASAMELYSGRTDGFILAGHESPRHRCIACTSVAGKLLEFLIALRFMAITRGDATLSQTLRDDATAITASGEDSGKYCAAL